MQPNLGVFVRNRLEALSAFTEVQVVAPVPWVPSCCPGNRARLYRLIPAKECIGGLETYHPRYLVTPKVLRRLYGMMYFRSIVGFIRKLHRENPFDIIDVHWAYPDGYAGVALANLLGVPVSVSLRGSDIHTYTKKAAIRKLIVHTLQQADLIIPVAQSMVSLVENLGVSPERVLVVPNGVNGSIFTPMDRAEARAKVGLRTGSTVVLSVGRLEKPKRFDLLLRACTKLRQGIKADLQLVIVGDGSLGEELKTLVIEHGMTENVLFVGEVENKDLAPWYCAADLFCLASDNEGCPNVLLEAAACGTPIVASNVGGVPELVSRENGLVVPENTIESWSRCILAAMDARWDPSKISSTVLHRTWENIGQQVFEGFCACRCAPRR
ncbi:glycosyltransferase family 4 protein [Geomonas sp. RF6]|uniref:glycosyltransferase family 4 protein n=1 Tax=Geomonas sp. RF6 TaxID=2897342 RepID=UPI001E532487|nr:glycosyltransferase family 4 protein [Geomonas sp. RF6]UFS72829.1 glycosyltransferase family 4 protein [Geomonas sp. RF6]